MQSEVLNSSPLIEKLPKSPLSNLPKKGILGYFNLKPSKLLNSNSKLHPKHSKRFYMRCKPRKTNSRLFSMRPRGSSKQETSCKRITTRSVSFREGKHDSLDQEINPQVLKEKLLTSLKKTKAKNSVKVSKPANSKPLPLENKFSQGSKSKNAQVKGRKSLGKNEKAMLKSFISEFNSCVYDVDFSGARFLNYSQFCMVLKNLRFIENSFNKSEAETGLVLKAWKVLGGYEDGKVKSEELQYFLLVVLDLHFKPDSGVTVPISPQMKQKRSLLNMKLKDLARLHHDFQSFYTHRTAPKETKSDIESSSTSSQEISDSDSPDIVIEQASVLSPEVKEKEFQIIQDSSYLTSKLIKRISLRELSITPNNMSSKLLSPNHSGPFTYETPKNLSFNASESEDFFTKKLQNSPKSQESKNSICKIEVRRISTKGELDLSKDLNNSLSYKSPSLKFRFPGPDENSDSSILNMSEVHPTQNFYIRRSERIPTIAEGNQEELKSGEKFLDSFSN
jgi:hypothetical protein